MRTDEKTLVDRLRALSHQNDPIAVREETENIQVQDLAEAFARLDTEEQLAILPQLEPETAGYVLVELPTELTKRLIDELPDEVVAHYLDVLPMDDALDLREEIEPERFEALLNVIPEEDAQELRRLMSFPEGSAGQLLTENFVRVAPTQTMADVIELLRSASAEQFETVNYLYVQSEDQHLLGVLTLRRVLRADPNAVAREIMNADPITALATSKQEDVARILARYGFSAIPLLDERGRMLGILTADDAQEVLAAADTEDVLKLGAVSGDSESYLSLSVWELVKRRVPWLLALFVAESLTGNVLRYYGQGSDKELTLNPLAFFIPLLIGAGGNSGSQVTTTITRALALGEVKPADWARVMRREMITAILAGSILGTIGFLRAWLPIPVIGWGSTLSISAVVGLTLPAIIIWSATLGSLLPITAKRIGIDPAVMSAPFITTFVDATGLVIYFEIAHFLIRKG